MTSVVINGRRTRIPSNPTASDIRRAAGIRDDRILMRRAREGNFVVPPRTRLAVSSGDTFVDAPRRIKG